MRELIPFKPGLYASDTYKGPLEPGRDCIPGILAIFSMGALNVDANNREDAKTFLETAHRRVTENGIASYGTWLTGTLAECTAKTENLLAMIYAEELIENLKMSRHPGKETIAVEMRDLLNGLRSSDPQLVELSYRGIDDFFRKYGKLAEVMEYQKKNLSMGSCAAPDAHGDAGSKQ